MSDDGLPKGSRWVMVGKTGTNIWVKRIMLYQGRELILCVEGSDEEDFILGGEYDTFIWAEMKEVAHPVELEPGDIKCGDAIRKKSWEKHKSLLVTGVDFSGIIMSGEFHTYSALFDHWEYADGKPCSKEATNG